MFSLSFLQDEIDKLNKKVDTVQKQNQDLQKRLSETSQDAASSTSSTSLSPSCKGMKLKGREVKDDAEAFLALRAKFKEASSTYEKVKHDMDKMKEVWHILFQCAGIK